MSIKEIAKEAGTSPSTVSRVLNNPEYKCADPKLKDRIWDAAIRLNYKPNIAARNLRTGQMQGKAARTCYLNILMTRTDVTLTDPFFTELLHVIRSEIHKQACILSKIWYRPEFSDDRKLRSLNMERVVEEMDAETGGHCDGIIVMGKCNTEVLKRLNAHFHNVISVNRNTTNYLVDEILCDGVKVASMAVDYLISLGHTRIGYVGNTHQEARYKGYCATLMAHNLTVEPEVLIETNQTEMEGFLAMEHFLQMEDPPSGIYCANDITAIGMLKCLQQFKNKRYRPSVIASDDIRDAQFSEPMLTTVHLPKEEMGKFAVMMLLDRIHEGHKSIARMELEGKLMVRSSCAPLQK